MSNTTNTNTGALADKDTNKANKLPSVGLLPPGATGAIAASSATRHPIARNSSFDENARENEPPKAKPITSELTVVHKRINVLREIVCNDAKPRLSDPDVRDAYEQTSSDAVETALGAETKAIEAKWATDLADVKRALADHADELAAQKDVNADLKDELAAQKTAFAAQKDVNADLYKRLTSLEQSLVSRTTLAVVDREIAHAFCDALGVTPLDRLSNVLKLSEAQNHCHLHIYNRINVALHRVRNKLNKIAHPTEVDPALIFDELAKVMKEVDLNFLKKRVQCGQGSNADGAVSTSNLRK